MINYIRLFGLLSITFLATTITLGILLSKGKIPFKIHRLSAIITLLLSLTHVGIIYLR